MSSGVNIREEMSNQKLSSKEYWDTVLENAELPRVNSPKIYNYSVTMNFIDKYLKNEKNLKTLLEVGAGSSGWLPYFARKYGYIVSGLDYSEIGCKICEENLKLLNVKYDQVFCKDIFDPNCTNGQKYDILFSYGVIEHFEKPEELINIFNRLLNENGIIITLVPNYIGLKGLLTKVFVDHVYRMHKRIFKAQLRAMHEKNSFKNIKTSYVGSFGLGVVAWSKSKTWLFKPNSIQSKLAYKMIYLIEWFVVSFFKVLNFEAPTSFFSPYIITVAKKTDKSLSLSSLTKERE
jgi:2-polyprenyl-3-methyl-5-hydroxy-6-metoxy-1,4-benzoquinol methylase